MSAVPATHVRDARPRGKILYLENGERADQKTFHAWYETTPRTFKAELIGGEVVVASPVKLVHGQHHSLVMVWLGIYWVETPGSSLRDNTTIILGEESEPQPDAALAIEPALGGQSGINDDGYAIRAPESIFEIANSSGSIDMHRKKADYERAGVKEYCVILLRNKQVRWFVLRDGAFQEISPGSDGIYRSVVFPGLWLDAAALLRLDSVGVLASLRAGLASPEHVAFVQELAKRPTAPTPSPSLRSNKTPPAAGPPDPNLPG